MPPNKQRSIPVIDVFAGPGGLGEGFASFTDKHGKHPYQIALSIEKDPLAHQTLKLRSFFRQYPQKDVPDEYYQHLQGKLTLDELWKQHPAAAESAENETWRATLGDDKEAPLVQCLIATQLQAEP
ncbi:MAG TPA: hypothetical protein PLN21_14535 [Gemmatales bacterium]|nr:hypothetical protein [Gemmatales bacterium]